ncbi:MAG: SusC/RagA family TonB-linked outer membrane protein, partial [Alistipes senegalensis]|nr:SusC/RagA family TonB-linked outer membrane protein [Alistipes senegalensis]
EIIDKGFVYKDGQNTGEKNTKAITPYQFWNTNYDKSITEANVFDATFIKLREIVLAYQMPKKWFEHCFIGSLSVGFEARNLWLIKSNVPHIDPEASIFGPSSVGSGIEYAGIPSTRSYGFNIKLTF